MKMTREGLDLIKAHEGLRLEAYKCPSGVWTIGYGHTSAAGKPEVVKGMTIDSGEANAILMKDLAVYEGAVRNAVKVDLTDAQYSALVSFCYNVGPGNFRKSSVLKAVNDRRFDLVPARLALWNKGNGKVLPGLARRRADEAALFMSGKEVVFAEPDTEVSPSHGKPVLASTTNIAAIGVGAASAVSTVAQVTGDLSSIKEVIGPNVLAIVLGAICLIGVGYIIYERVLKSKTEGV